MCQKAGNVLLRHSSGSYTFGAVQCRCWNCPECEVALRKKWIDAFGEVATSETWQVKRFNYGNKWDAYCKRLRYWDCAWIKIKEEDGFLIVHEPLPDTPRYKQDRESMVSLDTAKAIVSTRGETAVRFSCARNFPRPEGWRKPVGDSGWELVANTKIPLSEVNKKLADNGLNPVMSFSHICGKSAEVLHKLLSPETLEQCRYRSSPLRSIPTFGGSRKHAKKVLSLNRIAP